MKVILAVVLVAAGVSLILGRPAAFYLRMANVAAWIKNAIRNLKGPGNGPA